jgi:predicted transcriptional regulator
VSILEKPVAPEGQTAELHFVLASVDRRRILSELQKEERHVNEIAKRLEMTATETLRQFQRMSEAGLLQKMPDGRYRVTPYARLVLDASSPLDFISKHKDYFQGHDAFLLPPEFRARLGELSGCMLITTTIDTINAVTEMFGEAQKRIDTVTMGTENIIKIEEQRSREGVKVRWLMHESVIPKAPSILRSWEKLPEIRWTPTVVGHIVVTDKAALLTIRGNNGGMTYESFVGRDPVFMKWAADLFAHEWEKAKPWYP